MQFLADAPRFLFFTGKGGVGKTSLACATAVHLADAGRRVLLVSTDPASNVGHVFGVSLSNRITPVAAVDRLSALEVDPQAAAKSYRDRIVEPVRGLLPDSVVAGIEEQLSGACTVEVAAFDEFTSLLTDGALLAAFEHVIFDTAPTGHTIRLLQLPGAWSRFLESGKGDASCLGPLAGLDKQRDRYRLAVDALSDPVRTRLVLVARAQQGSLAEVARTHDELLATGLSRQFLVVNGVLPASESAADPYAQAIHDREQRALAALPASLALLPRDTVPLKGFNLVGVNALRALLSDNTSAEPPLAQQGTALMAAQPLAALVEDIAADRHGLVMVMGKGGVGKTTLAAAIAVELAARGLRVHLTTTDPAAHVSQTLQGAVDGLRVSNIDPHAETERYRQHVLSTRGAGLDAEGRAMLEEDLRSPCTEEIAVFQAFSRIIREASTSFVIMDTAPTGHTLLLLDATGAYHREVARQLGNSGRRFVTPMMQLQDPRQTKVLIVTLAETTPVLEAASLQADLRRAGIEPWAWVVNQSLAAAAPISPLLRARADAERPFIADVGDRHAARMAVVACRQTNPWGRSNSVAWRLWETRVTS